MKPSEEIRRWGGLDTYKAIDKLDAVADKVEKMEAVLGAARAAVSTYQFLGLNEVAMYPIHMLRKTIEAYDNLDEGE